MAQPTLSITNWKEFQHYKNRDPIWIKMYTSLLNKHDWCSLPAAQRGNLVGLWMLASQSDGQIPFDPTFINHRLSTDTPVDFQLLEEKGFISLEQSASKLLASSASNPLELEEERREEKRREESAASAARASLLNREVEAEFERIWSDVLSIRVPSPTGKKHALRHWKASVKTSEDVDAAWTALKHYQNSTRVRKGFVKNASAWFNEWRDWEHGDPDVGRVVTLARPGFQG